MPYAGGYTGLKGKPGGKAAAGDRNSRVWPPSPYAPSWPYIPPSPSAPVCLPPSSPSIGVDLDEEVVDEAGDGGDLRGGGGGGCGVRAIGRDGG
jgi:hypothetical protein